MFYSAVARTAFKGDSQESLHHFWEMVAYVANTLIFILSGVVIAESFLGGDGIDKLMRTSVHSTFINSYTGNLRRMLNYTEYEMLNKALEAFRDLGDDEELGPADWDTVKKYISSLNDVNSEHIHPHSSSEPDDNLDHMNLKDIRIRFLNGVQAAYWVMFDEGRITQTIANLLMLSVDEAIDRVSDEALCDWKALKSYVNLPNYSKILRSTIIPQKLLTLFAVETLESACYICAAFLRAHRIARQQLNDFIGNSEIAATVNRESEEECEEAKKFLEDVCVAFPQVLRVVKTLTYSVLNHLIVMFII